MIQLGVLWTGFFQPCGFHTTWKWAPRADPGIQPGAPISAPSVHPWSVPVELFAYSQIVFTDYSWMSSRDELCIWYWGFLSFLIWFLLPIFVPLWFHIPNQTESRGLVNWDKLTMISYTIAILIEVLHSFFIHVWCWNEIFERLEVFWLCWDCWFHMDNRFLFGDISYGHVSYRSHQWTLQVVHTNELGCKI